jgi:ComF family protein
MRSWLVFEGPIRRALHGLKYRRNITLGNAIARHLSGYVSGLDWQVDMIVPIPLGKKRLKERGYNQVGLVARPLALSRRWQYVSDALTRSRETRTQVGLSATERRLNVRDAFRAERGMVAGQHVLLMDDVATTGATLATGATALMEAGASCVYGLTWHVHWLATAWTLFSNLSKSQRRNLWQ